MSRDAENSDSPHRCDYSGCPNWAGVKDPAGGPHGEDVWMCGLHENLIPEDHNGRLVWL